MAKHAKHPHPGRRPLRDSQPPIQMRLVDGVPYFGLPGEPSELGPGNKHYADCCQMFLRSGLLGPGAHPVAQALVGYANKCAKPLVGMDRLEMLYPEHDLAEQLLRIARASSARQAAGVISGYVRQACAPLDWDLKLMLDALNMGRRLEFRPFSYLPQADWRHVDEATDWAALPHPSTPFPGESAPPLIERMLQQPATTLPPAVVTVRVARALFRTETGYEMMDRTFRLWLIDEGLVSTGRQGAAKGIDREALLRKVREYKARCEAGAKVRRVARKVGS